MAEEQIEKYKKHFWDNCNNPNTVSRNLLTNNDIKVISIKDKDVLAFRIPFASRTERPVFLTRNPFGNTYKRNHEGDYRCTDEEVKRMLADSSAELKKDSLILEHYTISDLDLLQKIGVYRTDRKSGVEGLTVAGLLMFGELCSNIMPEVY